MKKLLKKIDKNYFFYLFVLISLFSIFAALSYLNILVKKQIGQINVLPSPMSYAPAPYPQINAGFLPNVSAQGAVIIDNNSKVRLFDKNSNLRFPPASTTKIMTALVALEYYKPDDLITIKQPNVEGSVLGFYQGEKFKFSDLLYVMLLPSSNEAALALAQNYPGGEGTFVAKMNEKAAELHLSNTHFQDPIGLDDQADYSTPYELTLVASEALKNPTFAKVVSTKYIQVKDLAGKVYDLNNLNVLLGIPGVNGVKTGHTEGAGDVLVTSRKITGGELIFAIMQSQDRFFDTQLLIDYLNNNVTYLTIHP